jgi:hypothetical protein
MDRESPAKLKNVRRAFRSQGWIIPKPSHLWVFILIAFMLPVSASAAKKFYVAANGNDAWSGKRAAPNPGKTDGPFATLEKARDAVRQLKKGGRIPAGGVTVWVRGGDYKVTQTFKLEAADSGSEKSPIVYRAFKGEKPIFSGGVRVTGFQPVSDPAILARLPEESRGKVVQADLKALGITSIPPLELGGSAGGRGFITHPVMELFFNGQALPLARWPNQGFVHVVKTGGEPTTPGGSENAHTGRIFYDGDRPQRWKDDKDILLYGYWYWDWADSYERVASIDPEKREIVLAPPYSGYGYRAGQRYYALNLLSEIDMPGEWYIDRASGMLYLYPPSDPAQAVVELSAAMFPFVQMENVSYVSLVGITWELGEVDGLMIHGGEHCLLAGCTVRRFGGNGVEIHGGTHHGLQSCDIYSMGRGGVVMAGGDRKDLSRGGHFVDNCEIYDLSRIDHTYTPAVVVSGVGNRITHNLFHDILSSAVRLEGNDQVMEYNEVYRVVTESDDQGGVDMFGDPTFRGDVIRYNYFHHIGNWRQQNEELPVGEAGVRLDDAISGVTVTGNVFYHCSAGRAGFGGLQIHGGKDNIVTNNIFAGNRTAISLSPWKEQRWRNYTAKSLNGIDAHLYLARYPELAKLSEDYNVNLIRSNLVYDCQEFLRRDSGRNKMQDNVITKENPGFADAAAGDFTLTRISPALKQANFEPIPFDRIGLYRDDYRKALPTEAVRKARAE